MASTDTLNSIVGQRTQNVFKRAGIVEPHLLVENPLNRFPGETKPLEHSLAVEICAALRRGSLGRIVVAPMREPT